MSFLKNIFGSDESPKQESKKMNWTLLKDVAQLNEIATSEKPAAIFKHSTRCSISRMALKQFENEFDSEAEVTPYFLDLLEYRSISDAIATKFGVHHQSPQLIVIKDGKAVYDASHGEIDAVLLKSKI
ncbi:bacillithiol system redox-active protein YtxJ [Flavobacterium algicola]|uniref:bacillithiol system redox-active protein YtxJ n=1 Tax=Flavobacterium algicola TaxID=556529 RepID=UPI001EFD3B26|nr:bacillithiol system redox-active protein YtxJ [Flavobacterium algicola]MCG9792992.1 bacillithiol system redox-active protein YtxJ [Flavobacterium algicola]